MANNKSAIKRNRQVGKRRLRNRVVMGNMRTAIKAARTAIESGEGNAAELLKDAVSRIDRAVVRGALKRNTGSRLISRLSRKSA